MKRLEIETMPSLFHKSPRFTDGEWAVINDALSYRANVCRIKAVESEDKNPRLAMELLGMAQVTELVMEKIRDDQKVDRLTDQTHD